MKMDQTTKLFIGGSVAFVLLVGGIASCAADDDDRVQVVQYGYYGPGNVWILYPTAHVVWVSPKTYKSDSKMYSSPSQVNTYKQTHTVVTESKTTKYNKDGSTTTTKTKTTNSTTNKTKTTSSNKGSSSSKKGK